MTRPIETVSVKWEDINLDKKQWSISSEIMKKGREHIVPLSSLALSLICEIKLLSNDSPYLFKSNRTASHISRSSLRQGIRRVGLNTTAHGLRALAATTLEEAGYVESAIKAALSHAKDGGDATTAAYLRSTFYDERANMLEYLGEKVRAERDSYLAAIKKTAMKELKKDSCQSESFYLFTLHALSLVVVNLTILRPRSCAILLIHQF